MSKPLRAGITVAWLAALAVPVQIALYDRELNRAVARYRANDCATARTASLRSIDVIGSLPQAYEVLAYCHLATGSPRRAVRAMEKAVAREPRNWQYHYGLALSRAAAGVDPRPALRESVRLNPLGARLQDAEQSYGHPDPRRWQLEADTDFRDFSTTHRFGAY